MLKKEHHRRLSERFRSWRNSNMSTLSAYTTWFIPKLSSCLYSSIASRIWRNIWTRTENVVLSILLQFAALCINSWKALRFATRIGFYIETLSRKTFWLIGKGAKNRRLWTCSCFRCSGEHFLEWSMCPQTRVCCRCFLTSFRRSWHSGIVHPMYFWGRGRTIPPSMSGPVDASSLKWFQACHYFAVETTKISCYILCAS